MELSRELIQEVSVTDCLPWPQTCIVLGNICTTTALCRALGDVFAVCVMSVMCMYFVICVHVGWAHVVCALYIPEVTFGNLRTMEPVVTSKLPRERFAKVSEDQADLCLQ